MIIKRLPIENIPEMVNIWNANAQQLTSDGKTHTVESLSDWHTSQSISKHYIYGVFHEENGTVLLIGFCITKEDPDISWIKMFALSDSARGRRMGTEVLKEIESKLLSGKIQCEVKESNATALNFFAKSGYKEIEFDQEYKEFIFQKIKT